MPCLESMAWKNGRKKAYGSSASPAETYFLSRTSCNKAAASGRQTWLILCGNNKTHLVLRLEGRVLWGGRVQSQALSCGRVRLCMNATR